MQKNQNLGSSVRASRPFYFLQFQALTFKHCSSFSCPNTFLFDLPSSLFITEDTVRFQNHFLKTYGRMPRSSRLLNCFWILCGRFQAINIFGKALLTVSMLAMFWFQFLRHWVEWIFHSIWWVGRFYRSPFANILKLFQSILRSLATRKVYKWSTSWTLGVNHIHQGFLLFFWSSSLCMLCLFRDAMFSVYSDLYYPIISRLIKKHWIQIILFWNGQYSILNQENSRRFVTIKACHYGLRHKFFYSWILGGRELKSSTVTTRHITTSQN